MNLLIKPAPVVLSLLILLSLVGCYKYPLTSSPSKTIDPRLLGTWHIQDQNKKNQGEMKFTRLSNTRYYVESSDENQPGTRRGIAFISTIERRDFLNLMDLGPVAYHRGTFEGLNVGAYWFYCLKFPNANTVQLSTLVLHVKNDASSSTLRHEVKEELSAGKLEFDSQLTLIRVR